MTSKLRFSSLAFLLAGPVLFAAEPASPAPGIPPVTARNPNQMMFREGGAGLPAYPVMAREETPPTRDARLKWFREARFGMFIHWGVYAVPAGSWKGRPAGAEWIMNRAKIPIAEYQPLAQQFTAAKYDPQAWVALAKEAGMKYVVLTAKHHDGFALYDSACSDWNAVQASGAKRDLIQPLAEAVRAAFSDQTHLSGYGGYLLSKLIVRGIQANVPALAQFVVADFKPMDPTHPEPPPAYLQESSGRRPPRRDATP